MLDALIAIAQAHTRSLCWVLQAMGCRTIEHLALLLLAVTLLKADWQLVQSKHFEMLTDADARIAESLLAELEHFRSTFIKFCEAEPEVGIRTTVVLFASPAGFDKYKPRYRGQPKGVSGYFVGSPINGFMALAIDQNLASTKRTIYHEYVHALFHEISWHPPLWLNEGTAEVFSTFSIRKAVGYLGEAPTEHARLLKQTKLMLMGRLLSIDHRSAEYNETGRSGLFYAQSWALAHFLICNADTTWRARLNALLPSLPSRGLQESEFKAALGAGFDEMSALLDDYIHGGRYTVLKYQLDEQGARASIKSRAATHEEKECILSLLEAYVTNPGQAGYRLLLLTEKYPDSPRLREAIAAVALREGDTERGMKNLRQAVELGTTNVRTYWVLGQNLRDTWLINGLGKQKRLGAAVVPELRTIFGRIVRESPQAIDAWEALARTEAFAPEPDRATLEQILRAGDKAGQDPRVIQMRMLAGFGLYRLGESAVAAEIAREVAASATADPRTKAFNAMLMGDLLP